MKHAVLTGSSSGIGFGMAREFLKSGYSVTISGRNESKLNISTEKLKDEFSSDKVFSKICDVRNPKEIETLWNNSYETFGKIDVWINNAGIGQDYKFVKDLGEIEINDLIDINIKGVIHGSRIVYQMMLEQGFGAIYNMEGFGSDGRKMAKLSVYGTTKSALTYFTKSFVKETKDSKVIIGLISPGMVVTKLFLKPEYNNSGEAKEFLKIANILADKVETVTPWLVQKIIKNRKHGAVFNWLNPWKVTGRFMIAPFKKRELIKESDLTIKE